MTAIKPKKESHNAAKHLVRKQSDEWLKQTIAALEKEIPVGQTILFASKKELKRRATVKKKWGDNLVFGTGSQENCSGALIPVEVKV